MSGLLDFIHRHAIAKIIGASLLAIIAMSRL